MATLQLEAGDVIEALNAADHEYLAELFNQWIDGKASNDDTHRRIGIHLLGKLCREHDAMERREQQQLAEERDRRQLEKNMRGLINPFAGAPQ